MIKKHLSIIFTAMIITLAFLTVTGCDEGMQMVDPIVPGPGEESTTNGEVKQPPENTEQPDPGEQNPGGQDPEQPATPTVSIDTVVQLDDGSVIISGASAELPEGTEVTVVLGDDAITVKAAIDKDGAWLVTVSAERTAQFAAGTIAVKATAKKATAESSFEHTPPPKPTVSIDTVVQADDGSVIISGTSTDLAAGEIITITLADTVTVTTATDATGTWSTTVPAKTAAQLTVGTVAVRAVVGGAEAASSFEYTPPEPEPAEPHENDFVGQVMTLNDGRDAGSRTNADAHVISGVTLTVVSGQQAGEQSVTDEQGNYRFSDPAGTTLQLHLRAEGEGYEPKEVIVHRSKPTETLGNGIILARGEDDPQETPGTILVGHEWPDEVRFILEETLLPHDLLLMRTDDLPKNYGGLYSRKGVVMVESGVCSALTIAHELAHAHQHAIAVKEIGLDASVGDWEETSEGKAYLAAQKKDWEEVGKISYDAGIFLTRLFENMAVTATNFWDMGGRLNTPCIPNTKIEEVPNRLRWAQEWLSKKYD